MPPKKKKNKNQVCTCKPCNESPIRCMEFADDMYTYLGWSVFKWELYNCDDFFVFEKADNS